MKNDGGITQTKNTAMVRLLLGCGGGSRGAFDPFTLMSP
jgi:hypothetical protein